MVILPELIDESFCEVDLESEAVKWRAAHPALFADGRANPLLDPAVCRRMVDEVHRARGVRWSYGGYLEDRRTLWAGSYLDREGNYLHLGVDCSVPQGATVCADLAADVVVVDDDDELDGGWGPRVILKPRVEGLEPVFLVYSHLQGITCAAGGTIAAGEPLGEVGGPPRNGNWYPHLHVQAVQEAHFADLILMDINNLDGYGHPERAEELAVLFPNPLPYVRLN